MVVMVVVMMVECVRERLWMREVLVLFRCVPLCVMCRALEQRVITCVMQDMRVAG
jgi:hypothetical protein